MGEWEAQVAAARRANKDIYFVTCITGNTVEASVILKTCKEYVAKSAMPHLYRIHRQHNWGLYPV